MVKYSKIVLIPSTLGTSDRDLFHAAYLFLDPTKTRFGAGWLNLTRDGHTDSSESLISGLPMWCLLSVKD